LRRKGCLVWNTALVLMVSLAETPLTGKPDAGNPPVRFGGRGGVNPPSLPLSWPGVVVYATPWVKPVMGST
jgi:hypothetical protein